MSNKHLLDFVRESGGTEMVLGLFDQALGDFTLPAGDTLSRANFIRRLLVERGFEYDDTVFCADKLLSLKRGNCLGYALLFGAMLLDCGDEVSFQVITHPKDAIHGQDQKLFGKLFRGEHFNYDNPKLPKIKDAPPNRAYRFFPLEHPSLFVGGKHFEVTSLEDLDEDPSWIPNAERVIEISFCELLSFVKIDRAQCLLEQEGDNLQEARDLVANGLKLWDLNREGWLSLWRIAFDLKDCELQRFAFSRYQAIGGDDSRFFQGMYEMTLDECYLKLSLERFPENILPFVSRYVELEKDAREAKFNLAVAAWCIVNSSCFDLERFYVIHEGLIRKLYGDKVWKTLFR